MVTPAGADEIEITSEEDSQKEEEKQLPADVSNIEED